MPTLAEIRARLQAQENKSNQTTKGQADNAIYPHWKIPENTAATVRFLPDADQTNLYGFWRERNVIRLPFNGIKGEQNSKLVTVQVPCIDMYLPDPNSDRSVCPILAEVRPWYKDETLVSKANAYWKKRTYLFQGFVRASSLKEEATPENPIRRFVFTKQLFPLIRSGITDPEVLELPTHYERGLDFNIRKTLKSGANSYADYTTSGYARRESSLTEAELAAIEKHGLYNLGDFLPKKPNDAELKIIMEMFEASVDGKPYDKERWGNYYRPYGVGGGGGDAEGDEVADVPVRASASVKTAVDDEDAVTTTSDVVVPPKNTGNQKPTQDILAVIRARQQKT